MPSHTRPAIKRLFLLLKRAAASNYFLYFIIGLFILSATWIAISFRYPFLFDERFHLGVIKVFSRQFSPIIYNQSHDFDMYGNLRFGLGTIYHYILSYPYRLLGIFIDNEHQIIVILRFINVLIVAWGLYIYSKLFNEIGISKALTNISLFLFTLIPLFVFESATISYDNMLFLATAAFFLYGARIVLSRGSTAVNYYAFILIGLFGALVKFTFLPVLFLGCGFVAIWTYRNRTSYTEIKSQIAKLSRVTIALLILPLIILGSLFVFRYGVSVAVYHTPVPRCDKLMSQERCLQNAVYNLENNARLTKYERVPSPVEMYVQEWTKTMLLQLDTTAGVTKNDKQEIGSRLPIIASLLSFGVMIGYALLLLQWKTLHKNTAWYFLMICSIGLAIALFLFNAVSYYSFNLDVNVQSKYLLSITPVFLAFATVAMSRLLENKLGLKLATVVAVILLATQGGGATKQLVNANPNWYWDDATLQATNTKLKLILQRLIKE